VSLAEHEKEDLIADLVAIVYSFTARLYARRQAPGEAQD
jgi:predicted site-specific integrase-resolvase